MRMQLMLGTIISLPAVISGCDRPRASSSSAVLPAESGQSVDGAVSIHCKTDPSFPSPLDVPEASSATEVELRKGTRELLVVSDSDRKGAALAYALPSGPARKLTLPLDPRVSDDVEGIAWWAGHLYAIVSTGYIERFTPAGSDAGDGKDARDAHGAGELARDVDAYALGPAPFVAGWATPSDYPPDFEGLCLRPPASAARCAGYAASRAYGWLFCLVFDGERLRVSPDHPRLALNVPSKSLSDCAFGAADGPARDTLLVATNIRGGSTVYRVSEESGALTPIDVEGTLNDEAIAVDDEGRLYQLMDGNSAQSPAVRAACSGW
jgi:hypothetical protein